MFSELLSKLRVLSLYYQTAHWQVKNSLFYADHQLFSRLYDSANSRIDAVAEKGVGVTGNRAEVNLKNHLAQVSMAASSLPTECSENAPYYQAALKLELSLLDFCKAVDAKSESSVGVKNMIGDIADDAEGRIYLIKQRLSK